MPPSEAVKAATRHEWRELGLHYDLDDDAKTWRFTGSLSGLRRFQEILLDYVADPRNVVLGEHEHYGPYMYLVMMTSDQANIDAEGIHGPIPDLARPAELVGRKLDQASPGSRFVVGPEYSTADRSLLFLVMEDGFDPASADPELNRCTERQRVTPREQVCWGGTTGLCAVRRYIRDNPAHWAQDRENPDRSDWQGRNSIAPRPLRPASPQPAPKEEPVPTKPDRKALDIPLGILGYCGTLAAPGHLSFAERWVADREFALPEVWKLDWQYPWPGGGAGESLEAVERLFPGLWL